MKGKEVKGYARKLSDMQGGHAKEVKFKSRELTGIEGKGNERTGRARCPVAGCVALACKSGRGQLAERLCRIPLGPLEQRSRAKLCAAAAWCRRPCACRGCG